MASELIVQTIQGPSSGANANKVLIPSGHTLDVSGGTLIPSAGAVVQVVNGDLGALSTSSTTYSDMGTLSITPTSASSKILVLFEYHLYIPSAASSTWRGGLVQLVRDTTTLMSDNSGYGDSHYFASNSDRQMKYVHRHNYNSPNTTDTVTYKVQGASKDGTYTQYFNNPSYGAGGRITLMEIAQ